ncbi:MAG: DUF4099 domain-containing protein [Prevotella sp.]|nr:DUF4099 domain-containing protein [Prevotella sp.]
MNKKFDESEIPYNILSEYGITQAMIDDFPQTVMDRFLCGLPTPLLPITKKKDDGSVIRSKASIIMLRGENGVDILFTVRWDNNPLDEYSKEEQDALRNGQVLLIEHPDYGRVYTQLDDSTNLVLLAPADIIDNNLASLQGVTEMSPTVANAIRSGSVKTFESSYGQATMGIDLHEITGIRLVSGNLRDYNDDIAKDRIPEYNFGLYGCWISKDGKTFGNYVTEENYTSDILAAEAETRRKNMSSVHL